MFFIFRSLPTRPKKRRDKIIFGKYEPEKYRYEIRRFKDLTVDKLKILLDEKFANPFEVHNYCPSIQEIFNFMKIYDGYKAHGCVSAPDRYYFFDLYGLEKNSPAKSEVEQNDFEAIFDHADEFQANKKMYCWFD